MMWERAWRATGRRTVAGTRISPPYFALVSKHWCKTRPTVADANILARWHEKNINALLEQWNSGYKSTDI